MTEGGPKVYEPSHMMFRKDKSISMLDKPVAGLTCRTPDSDFDVIVLGAGPAGLTASYLLTKAGLRTQVIERDPQYLGGISRTVDYKGFLFDIGGHRFFSKSQEVVDLWHELLPGDFIERARMSRIYYQGRFYSYPLNASQALFNLGFLESFRCLLSYVYRQAVPLRNPRTFHDWVANQFGERLFNIFFKTYTEKVWGMSCDEISADWAAQRIKGLNLWEAITSKLKKPARRSSQSYGHRAAVTAKSLIEHFHYPRRGPGMMWEAAGEKTLSQGGEISMGCELSGLSYEASSGLFSVTRRDTGGILHVSRSTHVISSVAITDLMSCLEPRPASLPSATSLRYRDFLTVALIVNRSELFPDNWIYIHDPELKVGRIQNFRAWSPDMVPDKELSCLGLEYFCFENDALWSAPDSELIELSRRELAALGLCSPEDVVDGCVVRQKKAYPVYDDTYKDNICAIREELSEKYPDLHLVGRNGMHKYNNQDHSMMTAMLTVRNILAGKQIFDVWNVNEDAEYHETNKNNPT